MSSIVQNIELLIAANAFLLAAILVALWVRGRRVNPAAVALLLGLGVLMTLNLVFDTTGINSPLTRIRWGVPMSFGPLIALYVWLDAGRALPSPRGLVAHAAGPALCTLLFSAGVLSANIATWLVPAQAALYLILIGRIRAEGPARLRARILLGLGTGLLAANLAQVVATLVDAGMGGALAIVVFLTLLGLVGFFLTAGLIDPAALFRTVREAVAPGLRSDLTPEDIARLNRRIDTLFQAEAPFLEPGYGLAQLADQLREPFRDVSRAINVGRGLSVPDFMNQCRVRAVEARLADARDQASLLDVAMDCGFSSKATFNRAFLRHAGVAPRAARAKAHNAI
jgi:AraC-like DNA-binding protein